VYYEYLFGTAKPMISGYDLLFGPALDLAKPMG